MSRTNPNQTRPTNPAKIFIEWAGKSDQGYLFFYDKESKEKKKIPFPFKFMLLDELSTIKGFNEPLGCGIYSNEVRNTQTDMLHVKSFKPGVSIRGLYADIKGEIKLAMGKFSKSLYVAIKGKNETVIGNINLKGISFSAWADFCKNNSKLYEGGITVTGSEIFENKLGKFLKPVFQLSDVTPEEDDIAGVLQNELKLYLAAYFATPTTETTHEESLDETMAPDDAYVKTQVEELEEEMKEERMNLGAGDDEIDDLPF